MGGKRDRQGKKGITTSSQKYKNPEPFLPTEQPTVSKTTKKPKEKKLKKSRGQHEDDDYENDEEETMIPNKLSEKIFKVAYRQQREIQDEEEQEEKNINIANKVVADVEGDDDDEDIDEFDGFDEDDTQSHFNDDNYQDVINEDDERILEVFLSKDAGPQQTLGDVIAAKIKANDVAASAEARPMPKLNNEIIDHYKAMGKILSTYTLGKLPKGFKHIPSLQCWEEVLYLTEPEKWSPAAVYQATRIFASNMNRNKAEKFYKLVLLPRVREDIRKHKKLHFSLYQTLKKALYKPAAFNKGILLPLFKSGTCNLREAVIFGSIVQKMSIPPAHSSVALLRLAEMDYCGTTSYMIKILVDKKYALPYRVVDALVGHFMRFQEDSRLMPVIWHQTLLSFVQRYKHEILKEDKEHLRSLMQKQKHYLVTPEILRELNTSRNRGEKEDVNMMTSPVSVINKTIEEDRFDIPEVPMEEDD